MHCFNLGRWKRRIAPSARCCCALSGMRALHLAYYFLYLFCLAGRDGSGACEVLHLATFLLPTSPFLLTSALSACLLVHYLLLFTLLQWFL
jgi:hypothetical protein